MADFHRNLIAIPACPSDLVPMLAKRELSIGVQGEKPAVVEVESGKSTVPFEARVDAEIHAELVNTTIEGNGSFEQAMLRFKSGETAGQEGSLQANPQKPAT